MGDLSTLGQGQVERQALNIRIHPCWRDHRFQDRAVLPAVEAMQLLAERVGRFRPAMPATRMGAARFEKFLELPDSDQSVEALCDLTPLAEGGMRAALLTRSRAGAAKLSRLKTHAQVDFLPRADGPLPELPLPDQGHFAEQPCFSVDPHRLYTDLVPFGPAYHNIHRTLLLNAQGARAGIRAPEIPGGCLGSPFVLDAAFHAACAWGQRFADVVAFPVGVDERLVLRPTQSGGSYTAHIIPVREDREELMFDIRITDAEDLLFERVRGVRMRDVSGGRLKPPDWIRHDPSAGKV
jgi:hypothetical protein